MRHHCHLRQISGTFSTSLHSAKNVFLISVEIQGSCALDAGVAFNLGFNVHTDNFIIILFYGNIKALNIKV